MAMGYNGFDYVKNVLVHEFGHHLMGGNEAHLQPGVWGMIGSYGSRSQMVSSYERHKLGWKSFIQYDFNPLFPITLNDYLTTGDALRIKIPGTTQYYLLENHQRISVFDNIDNTNDGKGVYTLYQYSDVDGKIYFINAEGKMGLAT